MQQESLDLVAEADELHAFLLTLEESDWDRPTPFKGWTPWDVVAHLHIGDRLSLLSLNDKKAFHERLLQLMEAMASGITATEQARQSVGDLAPPDLLQSWHKTCVDLAKQLGSCDQQQRLPWAGRDMGVRSFTAARLMETWAHGQDVYDLKREPRQYTDRIRPIAELGVKTFGWTFVNRGQEAPSDPPHVRLNAPSGAIWKWRPPSTSNQIRGAAVEFCQVVTQVRNVADTSLQITGDTAQRWMAWAQCFAGPPTDPPRPGERLWPKTA